MLTPYSWPDPPPRRPTLREQISSAFVVAAGWLVIGGILAACVAIELGEQVRQKLTGRRS